LSGSGGEFFLVLRIQLQEPMRALDEVREHYKAELEIAQDLDIYELS